MQQQHMFKILVGKTSIQNIIDKYPEKRILGLTVIS